LHRLLMIPGLGADARLFEPQRAVLPELEVLEWIPARGEESFEAYAARLAERIPRDPPPVLVGVSMGGMIAVQVAERLGARGVVLVSSCTSRRAINIAAYPIEWISRPLPDRALDRLRRSRIAGRVIFGQHSPRQREQLMAMLVDTPLPFLRWAGRAILRWRGPGQITVPIRQIHGKRDRVIVPYRVRADRWIAGGGHLLNITHPAEVNEFIVDALRRFGV
jgi:pimeloyl-ACP methyl ester carboxylesterase